MTLKLNLPIAPTPFVGRADELAKIIELLTISDCRMLTLIGPGGIGKTRLAIEAAAIQGDAFPDGVHFAGLQSIDSPEEFVPYLASVLGFQFYQGEDAKQQLLGFLRDKHMLLVLDNFEHLLAGSDNTSEILSIASQLKLLVTSRESLNLREEWLYIVEGMKYPDDDAKHHIADYDAIQLFVKCARKIRHDFSLQRERTAIVRICQLVEGMPLALELAAIWLKSLSSQDIADQIQRSIDFLSTTVRNFPAKHRSIRVVFDHSWNMLSKEEKEVFAKLTIFRGRFTSDAAQQVTGATRFTLSALVDKSLLQRTSTGKYEIHSLLRQYGQECLKDLGEDEGTCDRHSEYYLSVLGLCENNLKGKRQLQALKEIASDYVNIRAAWEWAVQRKNYALIQPTLESLYWFCVFRSRFQEGADLLALIPQESSNTPGSLAERIWGLANSHRIDLLALGSIEPRALGLIDSSLQIAQRHGDKAEIAFCLTLIGQSALAESDHARALIFYQDALACYRELDDQFSVARMLQHIGSCHFISQKKLEDARNVIQDSLHIARDIGDQIGMANCLSNLGTIVCLLGDLDHGVEANYGESLAIRREMGDVANTAAQTGQLAMFAFRQGKIAKSKMLASDAYKIARSINHTVCERYALTVLGLNACVEEDYRHGKQLLEKACTRGGSTFTAALIEVGHALVACGYADFPLAKERIQPPFRYFSTFSISYSTLCLPIAALLRIQEGNVLSGIELLSLILHHPASRGIWAEQWPLLTQVRTDCLKNLGEDSFAVAWERGKELDLDHVVSVLREDLWTPWSNIEQTEVLISASMQVANHSLTEPLTRRELEIICHMSKGYTNQEIANQLVISVSTVKKHITHIYSKLGTNDRIKAVNQARRLDILPPSTH